MLIIWHILLLTHQYSCLPILVFAGHSAQEYRSQDPQQKINHICEQSIPAVCRVVNLDIMDRHSYLPVHYFNRVNRFL